MEVSCEVIARLINRAEKHVYYLVNTGVLRVLDNGKFDLGQTMQMWCAYQDTRIKAKPQPRPAELSIEHEKALKLQIERERAAIELEIEKGNLHYETDVRNFVEGMIMVTRQRIRNIPAKVTPRVRGKKSEREVRLILQEEIDSALSSLPESYDPRKVFYEEGEDDSEEDEDSDSDGRVSGVEGSYR